jgi:hypothetical protein
MRPNPTHSLRLPPFTAQELKDVVEALKNEGVGLRQDDLVAVLINRATAFVGDKKALDKLGAEIRSYRAKAKPLGF